MPPGAAALPRRRGASGCRWHHCGSWRRPVPPGLTWAAGGCAGRWGRGLGAQQPPGQPGDHGDPPRPGAACLAAVPRGRCCRLWRQGQGAGAGLWMAVQRAPDAWRSRVTGTAGACRRFSGWHGCGCCRGDASPSGTLGAVACGASTGSELWLWLWLWSRSWLWSREQEQGGSRRRSRQPPSGAGAGAGQQGNWGAVSLHLLHRSGLKQPPATRTRGPPAQAQRVPQGYPQQIHLVWKGCRARAPANRAGVGLGISWAVHIKIEIQLLYRCWGRSCCHWSGCRSRCRGERMAALPAELGTQLAAQHISGQCVAPAGHHSLCSTWHPRGFRWRRRGQFKLMGLPC